MAIEKFRFVSPGVQVNEIDDSILPEPVQAVGPVVIGTTAKGPAMQPVLLNSVADLEKVFGAAVGSKVSGQDYWRTGLPTAPTFATYAAAAYLRNNFPVTVIRLAGVEWDGSKGDTNASKPGWSTSNVHRIFSVNGTTDEATLIANIYASSLVSVEFYKASSASWVTDDGGPVTNSEFKLRIGGAGGLEVTCNLDQGSPNFIRNVLNTDPTKYNHPNADIRTGYFLGESFENSIGTIASVYIHSFTNATEFISTAGATSAETGYVLGDTVSASKPKRLFKFIGLNSGASLGKDIKISIENVRASRNTNVTQYGSFDVVIRKLYETSTVNVLERFSNLSLDPQADNYIAKKIGDSYRKWNLENSSFEEYGTYQNRSAYVRVEMSTDTYFKTDLPHGFEMFEMPTYSLGSSGLTSVYPTLPIYNTGVSVSAAKKVRVGVLSNAVDNSDLVDITSHKAFGTISNTTKYFHTRFYVYSAATGLGAYVYGTLNTVKDILLDGAIAGFDIPLYGGTDAKDITQEEPFVNKLILDANTTTTGNAAYRAVKRAIDIVANVENIDMNTLCVPNLKTEELTEYMLEVARDRGDTVAIIDLAGDYEHAFETNDGFEVPASDAKTVADDLLLRSIDNSYGAAYFPAVFVPSAGIYMPASIAALGAFGGTDGRSALWFAPAGFNRGGLTERNSGITVSRTARHLNSTDRDTLYAASINPIATFPNEGVVIFGQKTLQAYPSALDRVNVRRLVNFIKKEVSRAATRVLFEPNLENTWNSFKASVEPFLLAIKNNYGLDDAKIELDETTTTADLVDRNIMYCKIYLKPTRAVEFIAIDFVVTNSGAAFTE